jgi:hypothetical protein
MEEISEINCIPDGDSQFIIEDLLGNADTWEMVDCFTQALDDLNIDWLNVEVIEED